MGLWREHLLPRLTDFGMRGGNFRVERPKCVAGAAGRVLELGFGSGLNLPHYTDAVDELLALEPSEVARKLAAKRIADAPFPVRFVGGRSFTAHIVAGASMPDRVLTVALRKDDDASSR